MQRLVGEQVGKTGTGLWPEDPGIVCVHPIGFRVSKCRRAQRVHQGDSFAVITGGNLAMEIKPRGYGCPKCWKSELKLISVSGRFSGRVEALHPRSIANLPESPPSAVFFSLISRSDT